MLPHLAKGGGEGDMLPRLAKGGEGDMLPCPAKGRACRN